MEEAEVLRLAKIQAWRFRNRRPIGIDQEDLIQAGCLAGIKAARRWKPEMGYECEAWVSLAARTGIIDELRRAAGGRHATAAKRRAVHVSIDAPLDGEADFTLADLLPAPNRDEAAEVERVAALALVLMEGIPVREKLALKAYAALGSMAEAARYFGVSESRIFQLISKGGERLRRQIERVEGG